MRKLAVWYHCKMSGEGIPDPDLALSIVTEQMDSLKQSGLADAADEINVRLNGPESDLMLLSAVVPPKALIGHNGPGKRSELPTIAVIREWLPSHRDWFVCYHHSKGVTRLEQGVFNIDGKAAHRRAMELWVIWNWRSCVGDLERGYDAVGINLVHPAKRPILPGCFFVGNFWWARAEHMLTLPPLPDNCPQFDTGTRCLAEGWVTSAYPRGRYLDYERPHLYS